MLKQAERMENEIRALLKKPVVQDNDIYNAEIVFHQLLLLSERVACTSYVSRASKLLNKAHDEWAWKYPERTVRGMIFER